MDATEDKMTLDLEQLRAHAPGQCSYRLPSKQFVLRKPCPSCAAMPDVLDERDRLREAVIALADAPHVIEIRRQGWSIEHTLRCRAALPDGMTGCPFHRAASHWENQPGVVPGKYVVTLDAERRIVFQPDEELPPNLAAAVLAALSQQAPKEKP